MPMRAAGSSSSPSSTPAASRGLADQVVSVAREDRFRPAYGRYTIEVPRQCVFVGTANPALPARRTGNRRFWPVRCSVIDLEARARPGPALGRGGRPVPRGRYLVDRPRRSSTRPPSRSRRKRYQARCLGRPHRPLADPRPPPRQPRLRRLRGLAGRGGRGGTEPIFRRVGGRDPGRRAGHRTSEVDQRRPDAGWRIPQVQRLGALPAPVGRRPRVAESQTSGGDVLAMARGAARQPSRCDPQATDTARLIRDCFHHRLHAQQRLGSPGARPLRGSPRRRRQSAARGRRPCPD